MVNQMEPQFVQIQTSLSISVRVAPGSTTLAPVITFVQPEEPNVNYQSTQILKLENPRQLYVTSWNLLVDMVLKSTVAVL